MTTQNLTNSNNRFYHSETVTAGATSDPVLIKPTPGSNDSTGKILVAVICTTANTIQYSIEPFASVDGGDWIPWEPGEVTESKGAELPEGVTGVRCVNSGASSSTFKIAC